MLITPGGKRGWAPQLGKPSSAKKNRQTKNIHERNRWSQFSRYLDRVIIFNSKWIRSLTGLFIVLAARLTWYLHDCKLLGKCNYWRGDFLFSFKNWVHSPGKKFKINSEIWTQARKWVENFDVTETPYCAESARNTNRNWKKKSDIFSFWNILCQFST